MTKLVILSAVMRAPVATFLLALGVVCIYFYLSLFNKCRVVSYGGFIRISLVADDVESLFLHLSAIFLSSLVK